MLFVVNPVQNRCRCNPSKLSAVLVVATNRELAQLR
jgi:hypothetical protein